MSSLFDVADVAVGDGDWSFGYDLEALHCGAVLFNQDWCSPGNTTNAIAGTASGQNSFSPVYRISSFGVEVSAKRPARCVTGLDIQGFLETLMDEKEQQAVANALWNGIPGWGAANAYLLNSDVTTVSASATITDTVANVLDTYARGMGPLGEAVVHLGVSAAVKLGAGGALDGHKIMGVGVPYVVSSGYPSDGVAVTGPIKIHRGTPQTIQVYELQVNRTYINANRLAAVEFEPCIAVRAV